MNEFRMLLLFVASMVGAFGALVCDAPLLAGWIVAAGGYATSRYDDGFNRRDATRLTSTCELGPPKP